jgi:hypothetical protein
MSIIQDVLQTLNYTEEDRLKDEIYHEQVIISRLQVTLGFAMTPVDLETTLSEIDRHEKRLRLLQEELQEFNRHGFKDRF